MAAILHFPATVPSSVERLTYFHETGVIKWMENLNPGDILQFVG